MHGVGVVVFHIPLQELVSIFQEGGVTVWWVSKSAQVPHLVGCVQVVLFHGGGEVMRAEDAVAWFSQDTALCVVPLCELCGGRV